jgi:hypothetical protein
MIPVDTINTTHDYVENHFEGSPRLVKDNPLLIKSKTRVQKHGEVFTPQWVVEKMIMIQGIKEKAEDVFATFLEPSAGEGAFLLAIENAKLQYVTNNYHGNDWATYALWALSSIYGIEFLEDNLLIARQNMLDLFGDYYEEINNVPLSPNTDLYKAAHTIICANIVQGNTLTHKNLYGEEITFSQWARVPGTICKVQRIPFTYSSLFEEEQEYTQASLFDYFRQSDYNARLFRYAIVDIEQVWKEEKENAA